MASSSHRDPVTNREAIAALLVRSVDPKVEHIDWTHIAATIYASCGLLLAPDQVADLYFLLLTSHQGREALEAAVAARERAGDSPVSAAAVRARNGALPLLCDEEGASGGNDGGGADASDAAGVGSSRISRSGKKTAAASFVEHSSTLRDDAICRPEHLLELLNRCRTLPSSEPFWEPLAPKTMMLYSSHSLGPYSEVVHAPMSLAVVQAKISSGEITTLREFKAHVWHIAANCVMFNAPEGGYPAIAREFAEAAVAMIDAQVEENPAKRSRF